MNWIRSAVTDDKGSFDVAYVSLFMVSLGVLGSIPFMCVMSAISYMRCVPQAIKDAPLVVCGYDPQPLGIAIGAVAGGFATALGALAAYMAATKRQPQVQP